MFGNHQWADPKGKSHRGRVPNKYANDDRPSVRPTRTPKVFCEAKSFPRYSTGCFHISTFLSQLYVAEICLASSVKHEPEGRSGHETVSHRALPGRGWHESPRITELCPGTNCKILPDLSRLRPSVCWAHRAAIVFAAGSLLILLPVTGVFLTDITSLVLWLRTLPWSVATRWAFTNYKWVYGALTTLLVGVITSFITIIGALLVTILKKEWTKSWNLKVFHPKGKGETSTHTINFWVPAVSFFGGVKLGFACLVVWKKI